MTAHLARITRAALLAALVLGALSAGAARADDRGTATAVLSAQAAELQQEKALNGCLAASPDRNTPCIRRESLRLAALDTRQIDAISRAMDGTERACVRTVARQEIAYMKLWRAGALALSADQRKKARRLFLRSGPIADAQARIETTCFTGVLGGSS